MVEGVFHRKNSVSIVIPNKSVPTAPSALESHLMNRRQRWETREMDREPRRPHLTKREIDVLWLIAFGHTDESISVVLGNKRTTISNHVSSILKKLNATSRASAVWEGVKLGILSIDLAESMSRNHRARCVCGAEFRSAIRVELKRNFREHAGSEHGIELTDDEIDEIINRENNRDAA